MFSLSQVFIYCQIVIVQCNDRPLICATLLQHPPQEYPDVRLFTVAPRMILVFASDDSIKYMRDILSNVSWEDSERSQEVSYDTQFEIGDFYCSTVSSSGTSFG